MVGIVRPVSPWLANRWNGSKPHSATVAKYQSRFGKLRELQSGYGKGFEITKIFVRTRMSSKCESQCQIFSCLCFSIGSSTGDYSQRGRRAGPGGSGWLILPGASPCWLPTPALIMLHAFLHDSKSLSTCLNKMAQDISPSLPRRIPITIRLLLVGLCAK